MNKFALAILLPTLLTFGSVHSNEISEPYRSIEVLPFDSHGWFGNATQLSDCFDEIQITDVIEIGSWLGCSTRFLANAIPANGKLYAIDTWRGSPEEEVHQKDPRLTYLYQQFLSNVIHAELTEKIVPFRMSSVEAARALNVKADLIYLDGAHDTASVYQDIIGWYPHLKEGGIMCGDDWLWPTVQTAVIKGAKELNKSIYTSKNFWRYY